MKRVLYVLGGAVIAYGLGYVLVSMFAHWYEPRYIKSDDDIGIAFIWSLLVLFGFVVIGAVLGNKLYLIRRSSEHAKETGC